MTKKEPSPIKRNLIRSTSDGHGHKNVGSLVESLVDLIEERNPGTEEMNLKSPDGDELWIFMKRNHMLTHKIPNIAKRRSNLGKFGQKRANFDLKWPKPYSEG